MGSKQATTKPTPSLKTVTPEMRPAEPDKPTAPTAKSDSSALAFLITGAESHGRTVALEATLDWRYLGKANFSLRPTSIQGQKSLEAALRFAQGALTLTKDCQARLEVTTPGKDALPRAKALTHEREIK